MSPADRYGDTYERAEQARLLIASSPGLSLREVGARVGLSHTTVAAVKREMADELPFEEPGASVWQPEQTPYAKLEDELEQSNRWVELYRLENRDLRALLGLTEDTEVNRGLRAQLGLPAREAKSRESLETQIAWYDAEAKRLRADLALLGVAEIARRLEELVPDRGSTTNRTSDAG